MVEGLDMRFLGRKWQKKNNSIHNSIRMSHLSRWRYHLELSTPSTKRTHPLRPSKVPVVVIGALQTEDHH